MIWCHYTRALVPLCVDQVTGSWDIMQSCKACTFETYVTWSGTAGSTPTSSLDTISLLLQSDPPVALGAFVDYLSCHICLVPYLCFRSLRFFAFDIIRPLLCYWFWHLNWWYLRSECGGLLPCCILLFSLILNHIFSFNACCTLNFWIQSETLSNC